MTHRIGRHERQYVDEHPHLKVYPSKCVPTNRSKTAWTNGVQAYERGRGGTSDQLVGWFYPPRLRHKKHHTREGPQMKIDRLAHLEEE